MIGVFNPATESTAASVSQRREANPNPQGNDKNFADVLSSFNSSPLLSQQHDNGVSQNPYREHLISAARKDPATAEELLSAWASPEHEEFPLIDISNWPAVRYTVSGEVQTVASEKYFTEMSAAAKTLRTAMVDAERVKGTPAADILEKVLAFNSALPERYKGMANITY